MKPIPSIEKMLKTIDDLQCDIDSEIKDDKKALEVWNKINLLTEDLIEIKENQTEWKQVI